MQAEKTRGVSRVARRASHANRSTLEGDGELRGPWIFPSASGGPRHIANIRARLWDRTLKRVSLRARPLYQARHTFATLMLGAGEAPQWVAEQLGHTTAEMVFRCYAKFIPNLTRKDGSAASRWLAEEGL